MLGRRAFGNGNVEAKRERPGAMRRDGVRALKCLQRTSPLRTIWALVRACDWAEGTNFCTASHSHDLVRNLGSKRIGLWSHDLPAVVSALGQPLGRHLLPGIGGLVMDPTAFTEPPKANSLDPIEGSMIECGNR